MTEDTSQYFFVDESGDTTFYNRYGRCILGEEGVSKILIIGFIRTSNPAPLRKAVLQLKQEVTSDRYLSKIPSIKKTITSFHAKDDCPEVREKFFKLIEPLDFKAEFFVARKKEKLFQSRHQGKENLFYDDLVTKLFQNKLHVAPLNTIYYAVRGNRKRAAPFNDAIMAAKFAFEKKWDKKVESKIDVLAQTPEGEPCLQIIDYMNWAVQRAFVKGEDRFLEFVYDKISYLVDVYDFDKYPKNFYSQKNKFDLKKISPL